MTPDRIRGAAKATLAGIVGVTAALGLFTSTPAEESGREVRATIAADGSATLTQVRGAEHRTAYRDIVGVLTICDGDTSNVTAGLTETREGCTRRLERQLVAHAAPVMRCIPTLADDGRDYQRWAAISLAYNVGVANVCGSTLARRFNARSWAAGCEAILPWDKAGRPLRPVRGLTLRRQRERQICLTGVAPGHTPANLDARVKAVR